MLRVTCAIIYHENKILVTQRGSQMSQPFKWEFPGGKIESGETEEACIIRELFEELHISVILTKKLKEIQYDYGDFQITLIPFVAEFHSGTITLTEHRSFAWLLPEDLKNLDWAAADVEVVEEVLRSFE